MTRNSTTHGISSSNSDVKLTVLAGGLTDGAVADVVADDITLHSGNITLKVTDNFSQVAGNVILASGLQLLGAGSVHLDDSGNNVSTLAANYTGTISYTEDRKSVV